jgi:hypothetical protein
LHDSPEARAGRDFVYRLGGRALTLCEGLDMRSRVALAIALCTDSAVDTDTDALTFGLIEPRPGPGRLRIAIEPEYLEELEKLGIIRQFGSNERGIDLAIDWVALARLYGMAFRPDVRPSRPPPPSDPQVPNARRVA